MKIFLNQFKISKHYDENLNQTIEVFNKYSSADLIVSPELSITSFDYKNFKEASVFSELALIKLKELCQTNHTSYYSSFIIRKKNKFFNQGVFINKEGKIKARYNKKNLISALNEDKYFQAGKKLKKVKIDKIKAGLSICYDLRFPEIFRKFSKDEVELMLFTAQWPKVRKNHLLALAKARAIENQCFFILVNGLGSLFKKELAGSSMIIDPKGNIIHSFEENISDKLLTIDFENLYKYRKEFPVLYDYSRK